MATQSPSMATLVPSRVRPPNLQDPTRYVKVDRVPIIDTCERTYFKTDPRTGQQVKIEESIDRDQLQRILTNSRHRSEGGDLSPVFVGHTTDEDKEIDQPPIVGYLDNYQLGDHDGRVAILADLYLDKEDCDPSKTLRQFPRRSAEIIGIAKSTGYIDSVALLKRTPERPLGLVTSHYKKESEDIYRFECPGCEKKRMNMSSAFAEHEAKQNKVKGKKDVFKSALKLVELMGNSLFEDEASPSDPSDEETDILEDEPSMPATLKVSRHRKMSSSSESSEASEPSEELHDSSEPSEASGDDPSHPGAKNKRKERGEPSRMDPSEPSRMRTKEKKSKMAANGGEAGVAGPTTTPPKTSDHMSDSSEVEAKVKKTKMSSHRTRDRLRDEDERIHISRFQQIIDAQQARLDAIDAEKRQAVLERKLGQLVYEGYEIDRSKEIARFQKHNINTDEDVDEEITRMRSVYRQTPVGQGLIHSFSPDLGGASVERPKSIQQLREPLPEEYDTRGNEPIPIFGSHIARYAAQKGLLPKRPNPKDPKTLSADYGSDRIEAATNAISRFQADHGDKTRMGQ